MIEFTKFRYCPACSSANITKDSEKSILCQDCKFVYFHNTTTGVAAVIEKNKKVLVCKRAFDPRKGMLDLPGGFVDYNESLEDALMREVKEELNVDIKNISYIGSASNIYEYKDVTYFTTDVFFKCKIENLNTLQVADDVAQYLWMKIDELDPNLMAFPSVQKIIHEVIKKC